MRLHRLRFDIWLCLLVAYLVSLGTGAAASALSAATYDGYAEVHSAAPGQAGSPAGPEVPRAQSIAELPASILRAYRMERTSHPGRLSSRWAG